MNLDSFREWLDAYGQAWENQDPQAAANIFATEATYQETPFDEQIRGRDAITQYWLEETYVQEQVKFNYEILAVSENRGITRWQASFVRNPSRVKAKFDGIFVVYLNDENLCTVFEEWWNREEEL